MDRDTEFERFIEELKNKSDIVDVVSHYTTLEKSGGEFKAHCPFHADKDPSFYVRPAQQYYHCFSCLRTGDVIKFVEEYEDVDFIGAVEILAKRAGLTIPETKTYKNNEKVRKHKDRLLSLLKSAAKFYYLNLAGPKGQIGLDYLAQRGLTKETIIKYGFGLSLDYTGIVDYLKKEGYTVEEMVDAGVVYKTSRGDYSDSLAKRLIIPIINKQKDVIAFGGRTLEKEFNGGKYKNTRDTLIFNKSKSLFNANNAQRLKQENKLDKIIVVEGYMGTIMLAQNGVENVVASMGTSLTTDQATMICHLSKDVFISYDGDGAGQGATIRGLDILEKAGANVRVVELTDGLDPDDFTRKYGIEEYKKLLDEAIPLTDFKLKKIRQSLKLNSKNQIERKQAQGEYLKKALQVIATLDSLVDRETYLKQLQKETGFAIDYLKRELDNSDNKYGKKVNVVQTKQNIVDRDIKATRLILASIISNDGFDLNGLNVEEALFDRVYINIYEQIKICNKENRRVNIGSLADLIHEDDQKEFDEIVSLTNKTKEERSKIFNDCVNTLKRSIIDNKIEQLSKEYQDEGDIQKKQEIANQIANLTKEIGSIK